MINSTIFNLIGMTSKKVLIIGEFPIIHKGYVEFLNQKKTEKSSFFIGILNDELIKELTTFEPDIRKISLDDIKKIINTYLSPERYLVLGKQNFFDVFKKIKPDEILILRGEKSEDFCERYLSNTSFKNIVRFYDISLRWGSDKVYEAKKNVSNVFGGRELKTHRSFLEEARKEAQKSKCWWRQVGAVLTKGNKVIFRSHNTMFPYDDECYKIGCIRDDIPPGKDPEICSAIHAEAKLISEAAKNGVSLSGTTLYVTHFPCPVCAKMIALSGIKKVIYSLGSSVFDGERVMLNKGIKIIKLDL